MDRLVELNKGVFRPRITRTGARYGAKHKDGERYSTKDKIRIVVAGLRSEVRIAELCRQEGPSQGLYYSWLKEFLEADKKRIAGDTARQANTIEIKQLRKEARDLKEVFAEQALELRLLKNRMLEDGRKTNEVPCP
ncbi:Transposase [Pseudovibrio axinellae]|uniref:Transposase n=1 Tax=Pseudovibrio axinellae TaxID=989403 RepID=A0A161VBT5_9HYPH|nr:Transposase [Pseudovibrio axinellae]SER67699.1 transposase [Pseudovibrio axinellae]